MKASEVIKRLSEIIEEEGDLDVFYEYDGFYDIVLILRMDTYDNNSLRLVPTDRKVIVVEG